MLWADFLAQVPPGTEEQIDDLFTESNSKAKLSENDVRLYCTSDECGGIRFFNMIFVPSVNIPWQPSTFASENVFLSYWCKNCKSHWITFAIKVQRPVNVSGSTGMAVKFGQQPSFGPPVPSRLISLIGPDRDLFLRGRRSENQGLGIGAFAYYRRVVENQKGRLLSEIEKVARRQGAPEEVSALFEKAIKETQFSRAIDTVKDAIPQSLLIDGHNPLTLLHSALSEGLHAGTEDACLEMATNIRAVLTALAERISMILKDEAELKQALASLMKRQQS